MKWSVVTSLVVFAGVLSSVKAHKRVAKPIVQVYYESLCGDSRRFIQRQLYPLKTSPLGEYFYVDLIPYGKATTTQTGEGYSFECQHGPEECRGNKLHACAIRHLNESQSFEFVHCSMASSYPPNALNECGAKLGVSEGQKDTIKTCTNGDEGSNLLSKNGERTHSLSPKLYFVPWITFNGVFNEQKFQHSLADLKTVMCKELHDAGTTPEACEGIELGTEANQVDEGRSSTSISNAWWVHQPYLVLFATTLLTFHNRIISETV